MRGIAAYVAVFVMSFAVPAAASTPLDILLACVAEVGIEGQIKTESGGGNGLEFARITRNRNVSRREARRINACADGSGGFTGLNTGARRFGSGPVLPATTTRTIQVGDAVLTIPPPSPSCRPGGGVFQGGAAICVGF